MRTVFQHIEHIQGKPHHIRRRVAFGAAAAGTALIALVWLASSIGTGAFALKNTSFAGNAGEAEAPTVSGNAGPQNLAGTAAAVQSNTSGPARIEIVDADSSATAGKKAEQTILPF
ncbi:TPA: hypothetical protein DIV48_02650 [Candidatus Kaiserbacteria bacterium]|nr:MAG: hypothetical protein UY93_C0002G0372 [Parcubacteria group bacterium GW2011_GWA1_56_13]KKW46083.1 MAG: hypothetical protein UY97_C0010G0006 [Parcubacteria group bacterium GW2011_GWB1_57_6]HCR52526.1 hypothetical protein [Candidatus Kaiserbacteria bacterium]